MYLYLCIVILVYVSNAVCDRVPSSEIAYTENASDEVSAFRLDLGERKVFLGRPLPLFTRTIVFEPETILRNKSRARQTPRPTSVRS